MSGDERPYGSADTAAFDGDGKAVVLQRLKLIFGELEVLLQHERNEYFSLVKGNEHICR